MKYSFIQKSKSPNLWSNRIIYSSTESSKTIVKIDLTPNESFNAVTSLSQISYWIKTNCLAA